MSFNENLKEAMYIKNCTTKEPSAKTGINADTISSYLKTNGSLPTADKAVKIAAALDVSVEFLVEGFSDEKVSKSVLGGPIAAAIAVRRKVRAPVIEDIERLLVKFSKADLNAVYDVVGAIGGSTRGRGGAAQPRLEGRAERVPTVGRNGGGSRNPEKRVIGGICRAAGGNSEKGQRSKKFKGIFYALPSGKFLL